MPTLLTGSAADPGVSPQVSGPSSGDSIASAAVDTYLQLFVNWISWLRAHAAVVDGSNTFTVPQTIAALLSLNTGDLNLTASIGQKILKSGAGGLTVGVASSSGDLTLQGAGIPMLKLTSGGVTDWQSRTLSNLGAPAVSTDAATKGYVDGAPSVQAPGLAANWSGTIGVWKTHEGVVHIQGSLSAAAGAGATMFNLPTGYRPTTNRIFSIWDTVGAIAVPLLASSTAGAVSLYSGAPPTGHTYYLDGATFLGEA